MPSPADAPFAPPPPKEFGLTGGQTLVCLGSSITENPVGYCAMLAATIAATYPDRRIRVVNAGVSGNKITDLLARLDRDVLAHRPDWVAINTGLNDVWHGLTGSGGGGVALPDFERHLETLLARLQGAGAKVVLCPPTGIGEDRQSEGNKRLAAYRAAIRRIGAERDCRVAPTDTDFDAALSSGLLTGKAGHVLTRDGVHPLPPGDAIMAVAVLKTLGFFAAPPRN